MTEKKIHRTGLFVDCSCSTSNFIPNILSLLTRQDWRLLVATTTVFLMKTFSTSSWTGTCLYRCMELECNLRPLIKLMMKFHTFLNMTGSLKRPSKNWTATERYKDFADGEPDRVPVSTGWSEQSRHVRNYPSDRAAMGLACLCLN